MLNPLQLLGMARGVASGMEYLARMHFVHRVRKYFIFFEEYRKLDKFRGGGSSTSRLQYYCRLLLS
jgi:hypothetical protein